MACCAPTKAADPGEWRRQDRYAGRRAGCCCRRQHELEPDRRASASALGHGQPHRQPGCQARGRAKLEHRQVGRQCALLLDGGAPAWWASPSAWGKQAEGSLLRTVAPRRSSDGGCSIGSGTQGAAARTGRRGSSPHGQRQFALAAAALALYLGEGGSCKPALRRSAPPPGQAWPRSGAPGHAGWSTVTCAWASCR